VEKVNDEITVKMKLTDAVDLWTMIRDILEEDRKGKDNGRGGFFPAKDVFSFIRCMENLAIPIDDYNSKKEKKKKLTLV